MRLFDADMVEGYAKALGGVGFLNLHIEPEVATSPPMLYSACGLFSPCILTFETDDAVFSNKQRFG